MGPAFGGPLGFSLGSLMDNTALLVGTLKKGIQSWGYSIDSRFLHLRNTKSYLYIHIYIFATYSCHFSLSQSYIQNKQPTKSDNTWLLNDSLLQGPRDHHKFGGSMLTSHVMDHDMNVQIHVQILLGYCLPVHLGDQSPQILGLDHHQPSPQTPFVFYVYLDKN